ncbi:histidine kinase [Mesorhizobium sp. LHD-90]|uniref:histidine kinase n=1 Tax=Mesorhizobium sp. LHD-90 TaxID=3071414 RepID=UPI0027E188D7|nr:histidine kinase [Mesorhizobium sp. LHD-90]MDQ6432609.1 histidine kinase [Mesorhizobium sp. LHD-90]
MPTLFRFLTTLGIVVVLAYAAMFALATFVKPRQTEMIVDVPIGDRIAKPSP